MSVASRPEEWFFEVDGDQNSLLGVWGAAPGSELSERWGKGVLGFGVGKIALSNLILFLILK